MADLSTKQQQQAAAVSGDDSVKATTTTGWRNPLHMLSSEKRRDSTVPIPLFHQLLEAFEDGVTYDNKNTTATSDKVDAPIKRTGDDVVSATLDGEAAATIADVSSSSPLMALNPTILIDPFKYPKKNLVAWSLLLYGATNLGQIGSMFRWIHGGGSNVVEGYIQFLSKATAVIPGLLSVLRNKVRDLMRMTLREIGLGEELEPYLMNHFWRMCNALENHCTVMEAKRGVGNYYLLDTTHPTVADIAFGSVFEAYFLMDDPPAMEIMEGYPAVYRYAQRMMKVQNHQHTSSSTLATGAAEQLNDKAATAGNVEGSFADFEDSDEIPPSLLPLLTLALEVLPLHVSQCDAMRLFAHSLLSGASTGGGEVQEVGKVALDQLQRTVIGYGMDEEARVASASDSVSAPLTNSLKGFVVKPKLSEASWTVIADSSITTSCTKVQEVELAQLAAQGAMGLYPKYVPGAPISTANANSTAATTAIPYIDTLALCGQHIFKEAGLVPPSQLCFAANYEELVDQALQPPEVSIDFYAHKLTSPIAVAPTNVSLTGSNSDAASNINIGDQQGGSSSIEKRIQARTKQLHTCCAISMDVTEEGVGSSTTPSDRRRRTKTAQSEDIFIGSTSTKKAAYPDVRSDSPRAISNRRSTTSDSAMSMAAAEDELSMDDTLFALAVLLQRMVIPEVEVRSLFRKQTVSFALVPRKKWWQ